MDNIQNCDSYINIHRVLASCLFSICGSVILELNVSPMIGDSLGPWLCFQYQALLKLIVASNWKLRLLKLLKKCCFLKKKGRF
jgi:hypothetical protein